MLDATVILSKFALLGELAQLVERLHGMQEVSGSNPLFSTLQMKSFSIIVFCLHNILPNFK